MTKSTAIRAWHRTWLLACVFLLIGGLNAFGAATDIKVEMSGTQYTDFATPPVLTPNEDGTDDFLNFVFTGDNHEYRIVVDTDGDETAEPMIWDPAAGGGQGAQVGDDWTWMGYIPAGETAYVWWEGRDPEHRTVPNDTYQVWIIEDTGDDGFQTATTDATISVTVQTASISGTVTDEADAPIAGVRVNAGGPNGWGEAFSAGDGTYTVWGLKAGEYYMNAEKTGYVFNPQDGGGDPYRVTLSGDTATYDITLAEAEVVTLNVTLPQAFDPRPGNPDGELWINADAQRTNGSGWAHGNGSIADEDSSGDVILNFESLPEDAEWTVRVSAEYWYWEADAEHRLSYTGSTTFTGVPQAALEVNMERAVAITGTVNLPVGVTAANNLNINVRAVAQDDPSNEAWGWGNIQTGEATGTFNIPAVRKNTTYTVTVQVEGYRSAGTTVEVETADATAPEVTLDAGLSISGTLTLSEAVAEETYLMLDAWNQNDFNWHGIQVTIPNGQSSAAFTIGGLEDLSYQLWCWKEGYEFTVDGDMPWEALTSAGETGVSLELTAFSGAITGTISAPGADLTHVVIMTAPLWGGGCGMILPVVANDDGSYAVEGLSSGEYLLIVDEVADLMAEPPLPTGNVAMHSEVVFVTNGETVPLNITLGAPYTISGTITDDEGILAGVDATPGNIDDPEVFAVAIPMQFAMMNGIQGGTIMAPVSYDEGAYGFDLKLGEGTYLITLQSDAVDFAAQTRIKVVNADDDITLEVAEGNSATLTITFPSALAADANNPTFLGGLELYQGQQPLDTRYEILLRPTNPGWDPPAGINAVVVENGDSYAQVTFDNLLEGDYTARLYSPEYIMGTTSFTIGSSDVSASMALSTGATITGRLVDAETGANLLTGNNASSFSVSCEAFPWVDGSYKDTNWDMNSIDSQTGVFSLRNLPAGTYLVNAGFESDGSSNLNYATASKYGVTITGTGTFDVGSLKMKQGTTISGRVTDGDGNPLANIPVEAEVMDCKYGEVLLETKTGPDGYYTISGVDHDIPYYEVCAAIRPDPWEFHMRHCGYGEKFKLNVAPGATDVNFQLNEATATLEGTITIPVGFSFEPPVAEEDDLPFAYIVLQKKGVAYTEPMDGIEALSQPSETTSTTYSVDHLTPGTFRIMAMSKGLSTYVGEVTLTDGQTTTLNITLQQGATVSGTVTKPDGTYPTTSDLEMPVAMNASQELVFGSFTSDPATGEISAYEIKGLKVDETYYVALVSPGEDGPGDIYVQATTVSPQAASDTFSLNAVMTEGAPTFMLSAARSGDNLNINIFSTTHLRDESASDMIALTTGEGTVSNKILSPDKTMVSFTYEPAADETTLAFTLTGHYGADYTLVQQSYTIDLTVDGANQGLVNSFMGGTVNMGDGDASGVYFEPGDLEDTDDNGKTVVDVNKADVGAGSEALVRREARAAGTLIAPEAVDDLPAWATAASQQYEFSIGEDSVTAGSTVTVTLQYASGSDTDNLHVLHYTGGAWVVEDTNVTLDTDNRTISVEVTSLSPFVAVEGTPDDSGSSSSTPLLPSSSGGGTCFIDTAATGGAGYVLSLLLMGLALLIPARSRN